MLNFTPILRHYFTHRAKQVEATYSDVEKLQRRQLSWLLSRGAKTLYGQSHSFDTLRSYDDYAHRVPTAPCPTRLMWECHISVS
ncbi:MAG: GH3 auxin-responsive promoter family protein [Muribaculaceae bacterium]|nr:GH3 auxin-responsive promoter family protein [Muribaculaceae bacterium]